MLQPGIYTVQLTIIPAIERCAWNAERGQSMTGRQMAFLNQSDDLRLL